MTEVVTEASIGEAREPRRRAAHFVTFTFIIALSVLESPLSQAISDLSLGPPVVLLCPVIALRRQAIILLLFSFAQS